MRISANLCRWIDHQWWLAIISDESSLFRNIYIYIIIAMLFPWFPSSSSLTLAWKWNELRILRGTTKISFKVTSFPRAKCQVATGKLVSSLSRSGPTLVIGLQGCVKAMFPLITSEGQQTKKAIFKHSDSLPSLTKSICHFLLQLSRLVTTSNALWRF